MKKELNSISNYSTAHEIQLFRNMSSILRQKYQVAYIGETHQQYVHYHSPQIQQIVQCEISDLLIIAYSPTKGRIRMTFLQAKYHKKDLNPSQRIFKGSYFQYELLSNRPPLVKGTASKYHFPKDILSFSCCNSVGSYGIFYIDNNQDINLAYSSAKNITPRSSLPTSKKKKITDLEFPYYHSTSSFSTYCHCQTCQELIYCYDIDIFTTALLNLEIGAEVIHYPGVLSFIRNVVSPAIASPVISQLIQFIDTQTLNTDINNIQGDNIPINIIVINTDGEIKQ